VKKFTLVELNSEYITWWGYMLKAFYMQEKWNKWCGMQNFLGIIFSEKVSTHLCTHIHTYTCTFNSLFNDNSFNYLLNFGLLRTLVLIRLIIRRTIIFIRQILNFLFDALQFLNYFIVWGKIDIIMYKKNHS
jgi:hypothetical protein